MAIQNLFFLVYGYYFDRCLAMGLSSSCKTLEALSTAVQWTAQTKLGISYILHLLDDFLIISGSHEQCSRELTLFLELCSYLDIPMSPDKTIGPLYCIIICRYRAGYCAF